MKNPKLTICTLLTLSITVVVAIAGTMEWNMFRQGPQRLGATDSQLRPPLSVRWKFKAEGPIYSSPVVSAGVVYIGSRDNNIYAVDATTGLKKWSFKTGDWVDSTPLVQDGRVYVPSRDGAMYALSAAGGRLIWKTDVGGTHCSSPIAYNGKIIFGSGFPGKFVVALDMETGKELWKYVTGQIVYSSPTIFNNALYIGANDGKYTALNPDDGTEKWSVQTSGGIFLSTPAVTNGQVFAAPGDFDRNIYSWASADGKLLWKYGMPGQGELLVSSPAVDSTTVYICAGYPVIKLLAIEQQTGALLWETEIGAATQHGYLSSPAVGKEFVWAGTGDGKLLALDKVNGKIASETALDSPVLSSPTLTGDRIFAASSEGILYALW